MYRSLYTNSYINAVSVIKLQDAYTLPVVIYSSASTLGVPEINVSVSCILHSALLVQSSVMSSQQKLILLLKQSSK